MIASPERFLGEFFVYRGAGVRPELSNFDAWRIVDGPISQDGDRMIGLNEIPAYTQGRIFRDGERMTHARVQVMVRAPDKDTGYDKAKELEGHCDAVGGHSGGIGPVPITLPETGERAVFTSMLILVPTISIGQEKDRGHYLFTFHVQLEFN